MLVFFTTIVFGALMPAFIKIFKSFDDNTNAVAVNQYVEMENLNQSVDFGYLHPNFSNEYLICLLLVLLENPKRKMRKN
jgi:hypothetical protein